MLSQALLEKWKKLMREKYGVEDPTPQEVFEFATKITNYFEILAKVDARKNSNNESPKLIT